MDTIEEILNDAFTLLFPYEAEHGVVESTKLQKAALRCYLLLAMNIRHQAGSAEARYVITACKDVI